MLNWKKPINLFTKDCLNTDLLKLIKKSGFCGIDMGYDYDFFTDKAWKDKIYHIKENLDANGLECAQAHLPCYRNLLTSSDIIIEKIENDILLSFSTMPILGVKWGALHPRTAMDFGCDVERSRHDNKERIKVYLEEASKYNVGIAIENIPVFPDCSQYKFFTSNPDDHCELIDSFNSPLVGACWDIGHSNLMPYNQAEVIRQMGNRIKITHTHNNTTMCDLHICPAIGHIKWNEVIPALADTGFEGPLNLELNLNLIMPALLEDYLIFNSKAADELLKMA